MEGKHFCDFLSLVCRRTSWRWWHGCQRTGHRANVKKQLFLWSLC